MNTKTLVASLLTLSILAPVVAMGAVNCEPKNTRLSTAERTAYTRQCLIQASAPANVKRVAEQQKKMSCEQNAQNKALQGAARADYVARCVRSDEARDAAEAMLAKKKGVPASLERNYSANETAARIR